MAVFADSWSSFATSQDRIKGAVDDLIPSSSGRTLSELHPSCGPPARAMPHNPVEERLFKSDVVSRFLALKPLVTQDLLPLGQEFLVEQRALQQGGIVVTHWVHHSRWRLRVKRMQLVCHNFHHSSN